MLQGCYANYANIGAGSMSSSGGISREPFVFHVVFLRALV